MIICDKSKLGADGTGALTVCGGPVGGSVAVQ